MSLAKFMAAQLRQPSGFFGRNVLLHLLNRMNNPINSLAFEVLNVNPDDLVLEVGFGGGDLMARMARTVNHGHISGVDFSRDAVEHCSKRFAKEIQAGMMDLHCASAEELPFEAETFTKACAVNAIYFWPDPLVVLSHIHRVLKKGGVFAVCFTPRVFMENRQVMKHGFILYDTDQVGTLLTMAGFRDVQIMTGKHRLGECVAAAGKK
jgi:ubiquinone/menaquinone biosynthesis C-methylase UbiE